MNSANLENLSKSQLIALIDDLEFRLNEFTPQNTEILLFAYVFNLTKQEAKALCALAKGRAITQSQLRMVIAQSSDARENISKLVDVVIMKLRRKLKGHPIKIETVYGTGYVLSEGADYIAQMIEERRYR